MSVLTSDHVESVMRQASAWATDSQSQPELATALLVVAVVPEQLRGAAVTQTTRSRSVRTKRGS